MRSDRRRQLLLCSAKLAHSKHISIFSFLINRMCPLYESAYVSNPPQVARVLSVALNDKTSYVRKELYTIIFNAQQSSAQRDHLARDLYAILIQFILETSNYRLEPSSRDPPPLPRSSPLTKQGIKPALQQGRHPSLSQEPCPSYLRTGKTGSTSFPSTLPMNCSIRISYIQRYIFEAKYRRTERADGE